MIQFIETFKDRFGIKTICVNLAGTERRFITARGYRASKTRPSSVRSIRDDRLIGEITGIHSTNYSVYGVRKMHSAMRRAGWEIGRDQVARLMSKVQLRLAIRGRKPTTSTPATVSDGSLPDLVQRGFTTDAPKRLWVVDITLVATWSGSAYVAFVTDAFSRKIVGWNVSSRLTTGSLPL